MTWNLSETARKDREAYERVAIAWSNLGGQYDDLEERYGTLLDAKVALKEKLEMQTKAHAKEIAELREKLAHQTEVEEQLGAENEKLLDQVETLKNLLKSSEATTKSTASENSELVTVPKGFLVELVKLAKLAAKHETVSQEYRNLMVKQIEVK